jgi:hypothetical protein
MELVATPREWSTPTSVVSELIVSRPIGNDVAEHPVAGATVSHICGPKEEAL